jgi:hypothetical protein
MNDTIFPMTHADGSVHYSNLKKIALSGKEYLASLEPFEPSSAMLIGTAVHHLVLGPRPGKPVVHFSGARRSGKEWDAFEAAHSGAEILTAPEWSKALEVAHAIGEDPIATEYLAGARYEVPLEWEESGLKFSTGGVDVLGGIGGIGELKTSSTVHPETFQRQAFRMLYHCQLALYRRGAIANGIDVRPRSNSSHAFIIAAETRRPFDVTVHALSHELIELGDRTVALWIERLKSFVESRQFPGYAQSAIPWDVPPWLAGGEEDDDDGEEIAAQ